MPMPLHDIEAQALQLPPEERGRLADRLMRSLEPEPQDTPENIANAWEVEIARRTEEMGRRGQARRHQGGMIKTA